MTDIVKCLREAEKEGFYGHIGAEGAKTAADEIERLRAAIKSALDALGRDDAAWAAAQLHTVLEQSAPTCHPNDGPWVENGFGELVCSVCGNPRR